MKLNRIKTAIGLFVFLIGFCTFALLNTRHISGQMDELVHQAQSVKLNDESADDKAKAVAPLIDDIQNAWQKYEPLLDIYSRHDEVERISEGIDKLQPLYDNRSYTDLSLTLSEIDNALDHLMHTELPTVANIL